MEEEEIKVGISMDVYGLVSVWDAKGYSICLTTTKEIARKLWNIAVDVNQHTERGKRMESFKKSAIGLCPESEYIRSL